MSTPTILAISTPLIAIASLVFTYLSGSRDRRAALELRDEVQGLLRRGNAYLGQLDPDSRPGLQLVRASDDS